MEITTIC